MTDKSIPEVIAELRAMDVAELVQRYEAAFGKPPRVKHRDWLWRRIAWKVQEQRFGGLSEAAKRRLDELIGELDIPLAERTRTVSGKLKTNRAAKTPVAGTTLTRTWRGQEIRATSVDGGWEHESVVYRSLTAVAEHVTGAHWNGKLFFGISKRKDAS